jgi:rhodanese-related sulfurtransferase
MTTAALRLFGILAAAAVLGAGYNTAGGHLPWLPLQDVVRREDEWRKTVARAQEQHEQIKREADIALAEFSALAAAGAVVIDAREAEEFLAEHLDTPFILNVPAEHLSEQQARLDAVRTLGLPILLYCQSEECEASELVYIELRDGLGVQGMRIFYPGFEGLKAAGLPTQTGPGPGWLESVLAGGAPAAASSPTDSTSEQPPDQPSGGAE